MTAHTHELKTVQPFYDHVVSGDKTFEIRKDDRGGYAAGQRLRLREWTGTEYTGRFVEADVTYVTDYAQQPGYVVMGIRVLGGDA